jgi:predicted DNA binding protein
VVVDARIRIRHHQHYSQKLDPGVQVTHLSGDDTHCICTIRGPLGADLDAAVGTMAAFLDAPPVVLDRGTQSIAIRCNCPTRGIRARISSWGGTVVWPMVHKTGLGYYHIMAPNKEVMRSVLDHLRAEGEVEVVQVGSPTADELGVQISLGEITRELSAKQLDVMRFAIDRGYYGNPRGATLEELAKAYGLARSTFQEHLQKAEETIMFRFGGVVAYHPAILAAAMRKAGRPRASDSVL